MIILRYSQIYFLYIFFQSIGHNRSDKKKRGGVDLYVSEPQPHDYGVMTVHFPYISGNNIYLKIQYEIYCLKISYNIHQICYFFIFI